MAGEIDHIAESRLRHDVRLLDDGAHLYRLDLSSPHSVLLVTEHQYEKASLTGDPLLEVAEYVSLESFGEAEVAHDEHFDKDGKPIDPYVLTLDRPEGQP